MFYRCLSVHGGRCTPPSGQTPVPLGKHPSMQTSPFWTNTPLSRRPLDRHSTGQDNPPLANIRRQTHPQADTPPRQTHSPGRHPHRQAPPRWPLQQALSRSAGNSQGTCPMVGAASPEDGKSLTPSLNEQYRCE